MHAAFGLRATLLFDLAPGEYHSNVLLTVLAGRAVVIAADGFADSAVAEGIAALYAPHALLLSTAEKKAFAGNCLALAPDQVKRDHCISVAERGPRSSTIINSLHHVGTKGFGG